MSIASTVLPLLLGACDVNHRGRDASVPFNQRVAEVAIRVDQQAGGTPSVSVLAFRARTTGLLPSGVLEAVDPLVAAAPEARCELREVAGAARALRAQGGTIELHELEEVLVEVGPGGRALRPMPRVYPQLAAVVGGVIGEAGPFDVAALPDELAVTLGAAAEGEAARIPLALRGVPRLLDAADSPIAAGARLEVGEALALTVSGPQKTFLEIRPFGATLAIACPVGPGGRVIVPRDLVERLTAASGRVPVSFEAVWRDGQTVQSGGQPVRISLETRSSAVVDLRP